MDLRVESYSTWLFRKDYGGEFIYWNDEYHDAYTNQGNIMGSWLGRDARAIVTTSRYWLSGKTFVEGQYKQIKTRSQFVPAAACKQMRPSTPSLLINMIGCWASGSR